MCPFSQEDHERRRQQGQPSLEVAVDAVGCCAAAGLLIVDGSTAHQVAVRHVRQREAALAQRKVPTVNRPLRDERFQYVLKRSVRRGCRPSTQSSEGCSVRTIWQLHALWQSWVLSNQQQASSLILGADVARLWNILLIIAQNIAPDGVVARSALNHGSKLRGPEQRIVHFE